MRRYLIYAVLTGLGFSSFYHKFPQTQYNDLRFPANRLLINPVQLKPDVENFIDDIATPAFDDSTKECVSALPQFDHGMLLGASVTIDPHVHISKITANTGVSRWCVEYDFADIGGTFSNSLTAACANYTHDATVRKHALLDLGDITMPIAGVSAMMPLKICRDAANAADTIAGDVFLLEFDIHFPADQWGSIFETIKE
jgi:hypothetical protein